MTKQLTKLVTMTTQLIPTHYYDETANQTSYRDVTANEKTRYQEDIVNNTGYHDDKANENTLPRGDSRHQ